MSELSNRIETDNIYYIKLGEKGKLEEYCIENGVIYIGYGQVLTKEQHNNIGYYPEKIKEAFLKLKYPLQTASNYARQISSFYNADENNTIFFTFHNNMLYWCRAHKEVKIKEYTIKNKDYDDKFKTTIDGWSNKDINGKPLIISELNGALTQVQAYQSTLHASVSKNPDLKDYFLQKINGQEIPIIKKAKKIKTAIKRNILELMGTLNPKDFELLIDLIFSKSGWQRINSVGGTQKDIDIEMILPSTSEKAFVQIKSKSDIKEMKKYFSKFNAWADLDQDIKVMFYVINSIEKLPQKFQPSISKNKNIISEILPKEYQKLADKINILTGEKLAEMVLDAGLFNWLLKKAG